MQLFVLSVNAADIRASVSAHGCRRRYRPRNNSFRTFHHRGGRFCIAIVDFSAFNICGDSCNFNCALLTEATCCGVSLFIKPFSYSRFVRAAPSSFVCPGHPPSRTRSNDAYTFARTPCLPLPSSPSFYSPRPFSVPFGFSLRLLRLFHSAPPPPSLSRGNSAATLAPSTSTNILIIP